MKIFAIVGLTLAACSLANGLALKGLNPQRLAIQSQQQEPMLSEQQEEISPPPTPYHFSYGSEGSQSSRSESGDATGKVIGQYEIKGADGTQRIVTYTADSEGFRANITTNEPGTESQRPAFIILESNQMPAAMISRQLQEEADLAEPEGQLSEDPIEIAVQQPAKSLPAPRKASVKSTVARRPAAKQQAQLPVPTKSRRPLQPSAAPMKRVVAVPSKGQPAVRVRGQSKGISAPSTTTQQPRKLSVAKQPAPQMQEQAEEPEAQLSLTSDQSEGDALED